MNLNSYRDEDDMGQPDSYWRRRVIALVAGLSLLGVLAWAFSGGGKPVTPAPKTSQASGVVPAAAYSGAPSANGTGAASPGAATDHPTALGRVHAAASPGSGTQPASDCSPRAVVLSLFTSRTDYYGGQDPDFEVYAVFTGAGACTFDISPKKLQVVVMSSGRIIWDSADCASGQTSRVAKLRRGVPTQESVSWNRIISLPGCVTLASAPAPGTYQVQARTASVASSVRTFKLAR
ncbi:MAG: hypothetical protein ABSB76_10940 [Streptosporangiaceae bacterium]|jgi:hypothetical protein